MKSPSFAVFTMHPTKTVRIIDAGSEIGRVYLGGEKEIIRRPRRRPDRKGETALDSYEPASSQASLFKNIVC